MQLLGILTAIRRRPHARMHEVPRLPIRSDAKTIGNDLNLLIEVIASKLAEMHHGSISESITETEYRRGCKFIQRMTNLTLKTKNDFQIWRISFIRWPLSDERRSPTETPFLLVS